MPSVIDINCGGGGGGGDVVGPAIAVNNDIAVFDGTTGKLIKDGGQTIAQVIAAAGDVDGPASSVDDRIATFDGITGKIIQDGGMTIAQVLASATPGGADTQVQYNNGGAFGGDSAFTFDDSSEKRLTVTQIALNKAQVNATGSSTGDPAGFTTTNWSSGNALKFELAGPDAVIRGANGNGNMQLDSYYAIVMMGGRQSNNPGFIASSGADIGTLILPFASTDVPLIVRGAASQSANLQQWQNSSSTTLSFMSAAGLLGLRQGTSTDSVRAGGTANVNTTATGNVGAGEDDLLTYVVPANTLGTTGDSLHFEASGIFAATAANKRVRMRFGTGGTNLVFDTGALVTTTSQAWVISGRVIRTGSATQKAYVSWTSNETTLIATASFTAALDQDLTAAVTLRITGEATNNDDIVCESLVVKWDPNNT